MPVFLKLSKLIIDSPPAPGRPFEVTAQSTSITIGWSESYCDGGHPIKSFEIQYYEASEYYSRRTIQYIDPTRRNYTITGLHPSTSYSFSIRAVSMNSQTSSYTPFRSVSTLEPGMSYNNYYQVFGYAVVTHIHIYSCYACIV